MNSIQSIYAYFPKSMPFFQASTISEFATRHKVAMITAAVLVYWTACLTVYLMWQNRKVKHISQPVKVENVLKSEIEKTMQIFVFFYTTFTIESSENMTISRFKELICEKSGIAVDMQRLIYAGKQLEDNKTLKDFKIGKDATIHLVLRSRGD